MSRVWTTPRGSGTSPVKHLIQRHSPGQPAPASNPVRFLSPPRSCWWDRPSSAWAPAWPGGVGVRQAKAAPSRDKSPSSPGATAPARQAAAALEPPLALAPLAAAAVEDGLDVGLTPELLPKALVEIHPFPGHDIEEAGHGAPSVRTAPEYDR